MIKVAALFVQLDGVYSGLPSVDVWDETRDARTYNGPYPVVAHPPCQRWGKLWAGSPAVIARTGIRKTKGADGGCFEAALSAVRKWGGVLEHPYLSHAWPHFGLIRPPRGGGWIKADELGGWTCCVEQGQYGHYCRKPTYLYAVGCDLPELNWGVSQPRFPEYALARYGLKRCKKMGEMSFKGGGSSSKERDATPPQFRDLLLDMALTVLGTNART